MVTRSTRFITAILITAGLMAGCGSSGSTGAAQNDPEELKQFFPVKPGTRWVYSLTPGEVPPTNHWDVIWLGDGKQFRQTVDMSGDSKGRLELRVKGNALPPPLPEGQRYSAGVEIEVQKDDPYRHQFMADFQALDAGRSPFVVPRVYWGIGEKPFAIDEVHVFDTSHAPPDVPVGAVGRQTRTLMFSPFFESTEQLGTDVWLFSAPHDTAVPKYEGQPCLHFIRKIGSKESPLVTEDLWFAKGKGLVRLVQTVQGKTALTMELVEFSQPE